MNVEKYTDAEKQAHVKNAVKYDKVRKVFICEKPCRICEDFLEKNDTH